LPAKKRKINRRPLTEEQREAARERAYKMIEEGKFGGRQPGAGRRPTMPVSALSWHRLELITEAVRARASYPESESEEQTRRLVLSVADEDAFLATFDRADLVEKLVACIAHAVQRAYLPKAAVIDANTRETHLLFSARERELAAASKARPATAQHVRLHLVVSADFVNRSAWSTRQIWRSLTDVATISPDRYGIELIRDALQQAAHRLEAQQAAEEERNEKRRARQRERYHRGRAEEPASA
jgi:hypothetical protein